MLFQGWIRLAAAVVLLSAVEGCQSVPPVSDRVSSAVVPASAIEELPPESGPQSRLAAPEGRRPFEEEDDEDSGFQLSDLAPKKVYANLKELAGYGPNEDVAKGLYQEGQALYAEKHYAQAASRFKSAAARWPDSTLEEDALFMAGESYFFADEYPKANDYYERMLKKYEYSPHLDKVVGRLFSIGRYWEQVQTADPSWPIEPNFFDSTRPLFDTWGNAIKSYDMVRMHDPTGPLADDSIMATANAQFLKGHYEEASYNYDLLAKEYPKSEHQIPAHLLNMKSKMAMYQGPMYDASPLEGAGDVAEQTLTQFRGQLGEDRKLVLETKNRVMEEKAARDWAVAQYYDKKKCYGAARVYYKSLVDRYPQSVFAQRARARMEEIVGLPDEPTDHFRWLENMFPTDEDSHAHSFSRSTPLDWITNLFGGSGGPSEEFRDAQPR